MLALNKNLNIMHILEVFIQSGNAESGPPLGTVLGNLGLNTVKFCQEFNNFTKDLPSYFTLKVKIFIYDNRTFSFSVQRPSTGFLLKLLKFDFIFYVRLKGRFSKQNFSCISVNNLIKLAKFIFPFLTLTLSIYIIFGSIKSAGLSVVYK